ncbi:hypothetical protein U1Q18_001658 [Sarracenia purpurea var. burkii]
MCQSSGFSSPGLICLVGTRLGHSGSSDRHKARSLRPSLSGRHKARSLRPSLSGRRKIQPPDLPRTRAPGYLWPRHSSLGAQSLGLAPLAESVYLLASTPNSATTGRGRRSGCQFHGLAPLLPMVQSATREIGQCRRSADPRG